MFTLLVLPDGKCILATEEALPRGVPEHVREVFEAWADGKGRTLVIPETKVRLVESIELAIDEPVAA